MAITGVDINHDGTVDTLTATTDANGQYLFSRLPAGHYTVSVDSTTLPADMLPTYDYHWDTGDGLNHRAEYTLAGGEHFTGMDFGYTRTGSIGDTVWYDANNNQGQDPGEPGLSGVRVTLVGDVDLDGVPETVLTTTDADGHYRFDNLPGQNYTVSVDTTTLPGGMTQTYDLDGTATADTVSLSLAQDQDRVDVDFGYTGTGSIGDTVWYDRNLNGIQNGTETGIDGVRLGLTLDLDGDGQTDYTATTVTAGGGHYLFTGLPAGTYTITVDTTTLPGGMIQTHDPDGFRDNIAHLTLAAGTANLGQDFGYGYPPPEPPQPPTPVTPPEPVVPPAGLDADGLFMHQQFDRQTILPFTGRVIDYDQPILPVSPLYTGHAEPGTTLALTVYDGDGNPIGYETVMADSAGNWLAGFPGTVFMDLPHHMSIEQTIAPYNASTPGFFNTRVYFNPVFSNLVFTSTRLDVQTVLAYTPSRVMASVSNSDANPLPIGWDDFEGYEFLSPSINPARTGH